MADDLFIGLISGTSLDGIDAVLVRFENEQVKRLAHESWIAALEHARQVLREPEEINERQ